MYLELRALQFGQSLLLIFDIEFEIELQQENYCLNGES